MKLKLAAILVLFAMPAQAAFLTGNDLYQAGTSSNYAERNAASIYAMGVADAMQSLSVDLACIPTSVTGEQVRDIVIRALGEYPEVRHMAAIDIALLSIAVSFPCGEIQ